MTFLFWTIGPAIALAVANILQKVGLSRIAHQIHPTRPAEWVRLVVQNWIWWSGIALAGIATVAYFGALARFNISLVQPLMALNPVLTALIGWLVLKEHMDRRTGIAIGIVVFGLVLAGFLHGENKGVESPLRLWIFAAGCIVLLLMAQWRINHAESRKSLIAGVGFGLSSIFMKSLEEHFWNGGGAQLQGASDWFGMPLLHIISAVDVWTRVLAFVATYFTGFLLMQVALAHGRALFVIPLVSAVSMLIPSLAGILAFQEPFGVVKLVAIGLVALGSGLFIKPELRDQDQVRQRRQAPRRKWSLSRNNAY